MVIRCLHLSEVGELVSCLETGQASKILDAVLARDAIEICQMQAGKIV